MTFTLIGHYIEQGAEETDTEFLTRRADGGFDSTREFTIRLANTENGWRVDEFHSRFILTRFETKEAAPAGGGPLYACFTVSACGG